MAIIPALDINLQGELVAGLEGLLQQRERFDYILIETSGANYFRQACTARGLPQILVLNKPLTSTVSSLCASVGLANPGPVATALWTDAELEAGVSLDGIITVVVGRLGSACSPAYCRR